MMSLATIREVSRDAAVKASKKKMVPFTVEREDLQDWKQEYLGGTEKFQGFPFPFLGDYVPKGWKRTERNPLFVTERNPLFVDSSGFGREGEPALTIGQLLKGPNGLTIGKAYAIIEAGQFQLYLGEFERKGE